MPRKLFASLATKLEKKAQTNQYGPADMWKVRPTHLVPGPVSIALLAKTLSAMIIAGNATYVGRKSPRKKPNFKSNKEGINEKESYILLYINRNNSSSCLDPGC
jgi:hypothetical protein